jgi:hypothetical protein
MKWCYTLLVQTEFSSMDMGMCSNNNSREIVMNWVVLKKELSVKISL